MFGKNGGRVYIVAKNASGVLRNIVQTLPLWIPIELPENDRRGKRGSFKGAIGIPLRSVFFLFNDLMFLRISSKSLESQRCCFRSPPPPTNILLISL